MRDLKYAAFFECDNLNTFNFGNGVQTIGEFALANPMSDPGTMLTSLVIPNSVNTIQFQAFNENSNLTSIEFLADTPPTFKDDTGSPGNSDLFNGCATTTNKITIIIPATATKSV
ncbi:hypothetical protein FACS1894166_08270 [Bacilli bacterium]|nr:hypothetical protein FACS1894166_08270 [Bacilli bacterium]